MMSTSFLIENKKKERKLLNKPMTRSSSNFACKCVLSSLQIYRYILIENILFKLFETSFVLKSHDFVLSMINNQIVS